MKTMPMSDPQGQTQQAETAGQIGLAAQTGQNGQAEHREQRDQTEHREQRAQTKNPESSPLTAEEKPIVSPRERLRQHIKGCELEAEKLQLEFLESLVLSRSPAADSTKQYAGQAFPASAADLAVAMTNNLHALRHAMQYNQAMEKQYDYLVAAAIKLGQAD